MREFWDVQKKDTWVVKHHKDLRWKPPDFGLYKINFDSALFADWEGQVIGALSEKVKHPGSVDLVEALAHVEQLVFPKNSTFTRW